MSPDDLATLAPVAPGASQGGGAGGSMPPLCCPSGCETSGATELQRPGGTRTGRGPRARRGATGINSPAEFM